MQPQLVLVKTNKGVAEMEQRTLGLSLAMRRVLIMVDGRCSVGALMHDNAGAFDVVAILGRLIALELVAPAGGGSAPPPASLGVLAGGDASQALANMAEALLGTDAASKVAQKLNHAGNDPAALQLAVAACVRLIRLTIDETKAADFRRHAELIMTTHADTAEH